jgi:hypothetical protein
MLGRSIWYSTRAAFSPVRLRFDPPSLLFRTSTPLDQNSCRIPTPKLAHRRGIFAAGTLSLRLTALLRGAHLPSILRVTSSQSLCAPPRARPQLPLGGSYSDDDLQWWVDRIVSQR